MNITVLLENTMLFLFLGLIASYLGGAIFRKHERVASGLIAAMALGVSLWTCYQVLPALLSGGQDVTLFGFLGWHITLMGWLVVETGMLLTFIVAVYSLSYMEEDTGTNKFFPLLIILMMSVAGLSFTSDLFNLYIFFEVLSVASFALVAFRKDQWEPVEAGIKFLVMSATGSAMILLGIALVYKDLAALDLAALSRLAAAEGTGALWLPLSLFTVGFGIKAAIFPLHTWLPDAHAEAPSGISAMLSGIIIEAGLFALLRIFFAMGMNFPWGMMLIWFALITMTAGNIMALTQKNLKRMLAYSSVAQMGYMLLGIGIGAAFAVPSGAAGGIFHIVTHAFSKGLAFLCAGALIFRLGSGKIYDMHGAARRMPITGVAFTIAVLSLAGVPPFSGFMSKLLIYQSGIASATALGWTVSVVAILNSVFSLGYYLPAVGVLYARDTTSTASKVTEAPFAMTLALLALALITLYLGIMPDPVRSWVVTSVASGQ